jgi:hypothetical protein
MQAQVTKLVEANIRDEARRAEKAKWAPRLRELEAQAMAAKSNRERKELVDAACH